MLLDTLHEAWAAMRHNRRPTALTMLGMAWGIATLVLLLAYGNGCGQVMTNIFASFGTKTVILVPGRTSMQAGGQKAGAPLRLTPEDVDLLTKNVPQISRITPEVYKRANTTFLRANRYLGFEETYEGYRLCLPSEPLQLRDVGFARRESGFEFSHKIHVIVLAACAGLAREACCYHADR